MGAEFTVFKRSPKERYELDKCRRGFAPGYEPPKLAERLTAIYKQYTKDREGGMGALQAMLAASAPLTTPGWTAMWDIMGTDNYSVFKMSRWDRVALAEKLLQASANIDTMEEAQRVADDLLRWAGDDDCVLMPDDHSADDFKRVGFPTRGYKETGAIWDALRESDA